MKKKILPILALGTFGLASYAGTYMVVTKSDGTVVEYNVNDVDSVSYRTCRCECDLPVINTWSFIDGSKGGGSLIPSGSAVVFKGSGLSEITSVTFDDEEAEISFPLSTDNQLVLKVPTVTKGTGNAKFHTKTCKDGFEADFYVDIISNTPPCVTMCDNEFAVKTMKVVGNSLYAPLTAKFWDGKDYTIEASTEDGSIVIDDPNHATIYIPKGVADGGHIVFSNLAGETITDFIYRDTRNMLITHDDKDLNKFNGLRPDSTFVDYYYGKDYGIEIIGLEEEIKETIIEKNFQSENTNGNFSIFHRDGSDFVGLTYEPYNMDANPDEKAPKYSTPFGVFAKDILSGKTSPNDYTIKFEVFVSDYNPMQGECLILGFYDGISGHWADDTRKYCACWQPSIASFEKDDDGFWDETSIRCEKWSCPDWMTVSVPMEDILYDFRTGRYQTAPQNGRKIIDGSVEVYHYFGDKDNGYPFFTKNSNYSEMFGEIGTEDPFDLDDQSITGLAIVQGSYDQPIYDIKGRHPYIAIDNVRIVPKDNNGGYWHMTDWGVPTRDFYTKPVTSCR